MRDRRTPAARVAPPRPERRLAARATDRRMTRRPRTPRAPVEAVPPRLPARWATTARAVGRGGSARWAAPRTRRPRSRSGGSVHGSEILDPYPNDWRDRHRTMQSGRPRRGRRIAPRRIGVGGEIDRRIGGRAVPVVHSNDGHRGTPRGRAAAAVLPRRGPIGWTRSLRHDRRAIAPDHAGGSRAVAVDRALVVDEEGVGAVAVLVQDQPLAPFSQRDQGLDAGDIEHRPAREVGRADDRNDQVPVSGLDASRLRERLTALQLHHEQYARAGKQEAEEREPSKRPDVERTPEHGDRVCRGRGPGDGPVLAGDEADRRAAGSARADARQQLHVVELEAQHRG